MYLETPKLVSGLSQPTSSVLGCAVIDGAAKPSSVS